MQEIGSPAFIFWLGGPLELSYLEPVKYDLHIFSLILLCILYFQITLTNIISNLMTYLFSIYVSYMDTPIIYSF